MPRELVCSSAIYTVISMVVAVGFTVLFMAPFTPIADVLDPPPRTFIWFFLLTLILTPYVGAMSVLFVTCFRKCCGCHNKVQSFIACKPQPEA